MLVCGTVVREDRAEEMMLKFIDREIGSPKKKQ